MSIYKTHTLVITLNDWLKAGLTFDQYKNDKKRGYLKTQGRAAYGKPALIVWDSLRTDRREAIIEAIGDPRDKRIKGFEQYVEPDQAAMSYYSNYRLEDGRTLPQEVISEYYVNACVLKAANSELNVRCMMHTKSGHPITGVWEMIVSSIAAMSRDEWNHTLPSNPRRLRERLKLFIASGYPSLIHKGFGNQNRRKVTGDLERLIVALYCMRNKPFVTYVHELYHQFLGGVIDIVDLETGELFNREDFYDDHGKAIEISDSTVWNYVNLPHNRRLVDKYRSGGLEYDGKHRPHVHRKPPEYSFSKISMDDRDLPRKMHDGKRLKAYYSYDVASGAVIGAAYSKTKDVPLFIDCVRDMFRFIDRNGLCIPAEVEVEHHLVGTFRDTLMKTGLLFPFVRFCNPGNSKEKRAEHFNNRKKHGVEKTFQEGIGRPHARSEAHRTIQEKVFDESNDTYKTKTYTEKELIADDMRANEIYNNTLHPNQKKYKGMTRLDVLLQNQNPDLQPYDRALLLRYIGNHVPTTIRRNQYMQVQYNKYQLSHPDIVAKLQPNNLTVDAYYLPNEAGDIEQICIWQGGDYIDTCEKITRFQEAAIEQTITDKETYQKQALYIAQYDKSVKEAKKKIGKVAISKTDNYSENIEPELVEVSPLIEQVDEEDYMANYDPEYMALKAMESI